MWPLGFDFPVTKAWKTLRRWLPRRPCSSSQDSMSVKTSGKPAVSSSKKSMKLIELALGIHDAALDREEIGWFVISKGAQMDYKHKSLF